VRCDTSVSSSTGSTTNLVGFENVLYFDQRFMIRDFKVLLVGLSIGAEKGGREIQGESSSGGSHG
jgi:hypothetical protein